MHYILHDHNEMQKTEPRYLFFDLQPPEEIGKSFASFSLSGKQNHINTSAG